MSIAARLEPPLVREHRRLWKSHRAFRAAAGQIAPRRWRDVDVGPVPTDGVITNTSLMHHSDLVWKRRRRVFTQMGLAAITQVVEGAAVNGLRLDAGSRVLELGSGGGRLLRHLRALDGVELHGTDLIEENDTWCRANLPGIEFGLNELEPPLRYPDDHFDLVYAYSVFTHIPLELQGPWAAEVARVLRPNGIACLTILGSDMADRMMTAADQAEYEAAGEYEMGPDHPRVSASSAAISSWDTFMDDARLEHHWGSALEIIERRAGEQALVVARPKPTAA